MAGRPEIINKTKASSHPLKHGRFYTGSVTAVLSNGKINVKIPELGTQYGPLMPLNTTSTSRYVVGDSVKCAFADEFFNEIIVFGSTRVKEDVFAVSDRGIDRYASQAARNTDIPTPEEGRVVYLLDSDELQIYNGTEWITVIDTGNSENITAATLVATSASIGTLTVTSASTLTVLGATNLTASTTIGDISSTELSYLNGVTSAIQTQINTKSPSANPTFTGTVILPSTTSIGTVSSTEIGYLDGVTSAIQTQINTKSPSANPTFTGTVTIPTLSVSGNSSVSGSMSITGNTVVGGNLTVNGTTTTINSTVTTVDDPIITLGGDTAPSSDDNKDRGIEFRYHSGTAASVGFMGYDDSTGRFTFLTGATNTSEVFSGTLGTIDIGSIVTTGGTITVRPASTQDGVILQGRAGGTSTYAVTLTPGTLTGSRTLTLPDTAGTVVTTGDSQTVTSTMIANDTIVNEDINSAAAIVDTKLATISTAGKVSNSATTATSANTASAIVARDASGNFSAGTITAALSGNATTATTASYSTYWWAQSHVGSYYLVNNWDGSRWNLTSNHGAAVRVGYADSAGSAGSAGSVPASGITGQAGMWTSANRPGPYRLYRRDDNNDFSVQTYWTGSRWRLYGYVGDSGHADTHVGYADSAGSAGSAGSASNSSYSYYVYSLNPYAGDAYTGNVVKFQWDQPYIRFWIDGTNVFSARNGSAITGTAAKTFVINHPIKTDRYLVHACAEGPTSDVFYRGIGQLTNGFCTIELPEYFESLTEVEGRTVVLTPIYDNLSDEEIMPDQPEVKHSLSANLAATEVRNGKFDVAICGGYVVPNQQFYWRVDAVRKHTSFDVEPLIGEVSIAGEGPYTYVQH